MASGQQGTSSRRDGGGYEEDTAKLHDNLAASKAQCRELEKNLAEMDARAALTREARARSLADAATGNAALRQKAALEQKVDTLQSTLRASHAEVRVLECELVRSRTAERELDAQVSQAEAREGECRAEGSELRAEAGKWRRAGHATALAPAAVGRGTAHGRARCEHRKEIGVAQ